MKLIQDDAVIDKIVQLVMDVQNQENTTIPLLEKQLREVNKKLDNLMRTACTHGQRKNVWKLWKSKRMS